MSIEKINLHLFNYIEINVLICDYQESFTHYSLE